MKHALNLFGIIVVLALFGCQGERSFERQFRKTPEYVKSASGEEKDFYSAYDKAMKLWKPPFDELYVPTDWGMAHVIVSGADDAEPLVLLHGFNATSVMWYPNIEALVKDHRVYAIDILTEPGKSEFSDSIKNTDDILEWYHQIFEGLQLKEFSVVGASRGGWLSVHLALQQKVTIKKMALLSPAQTFEMMPPNPSIFSSIFYELIPDRKRLRKALGKMSTHSENIDDRYLDLYHLSMKRGTINKLIATMLPFSPKKLKSLEMPVLVLIGDEDDINGKKTIHTAELLLPNVETHELEDAGHFLSMDQSEQVNELMVEFLRPASEEELSEE